MLPRRRVAAVWFMPTISRFYGIAIEMFWNDHAPPHFHARYAEWEASISIATLEVLHGELPRHAMALTLEWAAVHRTELMENWDQCARKHPPRQIPGLE